MINATSISASRTPFPAEPRSLRPVLPANTLEIRPVSTPFERRATAALVRRMYRWRGYQIDDRSSAFDDPDSLTIAAWRGDEIAATMMLRRDGAKGLLCESLYPDEVKQFRAGNRTICEYSRLAVNPEFRSPGLLDTFFLAAYQAARHRFDATDALVEVNPRHSRFYQRQFGFSRAGGLRICPRVDAPAILLHRALHRQIT